MNHAMRQYTKILTARTSKKNRCSGPDGAWLVPASNRDHSGFKLGDQEHFFVTLEGRAPNLFGWVNLLDEPLTAEDLQNRDRCSLVGVTGEERGVEVPDLAAYDAYLKKLATYAVGTPMAATIQEVKLPGAKRRSVIVHKIRFY